uniref:DNA-directed RNA polymerase RBP11-like dimerisation domain-containing protein n=1 Tax=Haptolina brevifila TaxID=156173 RepID=A0A7S2HSS4_9EUKA|mmetsp:Transcript_57441/g.114014  ORF Transcript_57441/g.114014 Transcript_57441/m.114014 type:complete len:123 (+) Transcript_57441:101-469(+)|eukprot:CAMPEP_0174714946 /NCGR_PEP_ID=MMETSP1094-20130205/19747_1 /TAXON_ID=156173 /ORGANISM="Chrysochromulina brevifilum, Strain UTEX LB 985" /LENGTH=122 /DNA_ID=CAMNT_0015914417 /DNA_START=95 /DNA_END=463 /DNA_ORIENTATION=+
MNKPDDFDCWRLPEDDSVQKVTLTPDTKVPNAMTVVIEREDHTLGNILRMQLLEHKEIIFSGYRVPHPLEPAIQVKVQTRSDNPGPVQAMHDAIDSLRSELDDFSQRFQAELDKEIRNKMQD